VGEDRDRTGDVDIRGYAGVAVDLDVHFAGAFEEPPLS
jgi:hypothetical protein